MALLVASQSKTVISIWKSWQTDKCFPKCVSKLSHVSHEGSQAMVYACNKAANLEGVL